MRDQCYQNSKRLNEKEMYKDLVTRSMIDVINKKLNNCKHRPHGYVLYKATWSQIIVQNQVSLLQQINCYILRPKILASMNW